MSRKADSLKQQIATRPPRAIPKRASLAHPLQPTYDIDFPTRSTVTEPLQARHRLHFLTFVGVGMLLVVGFLALWNFVLVPWWQSYQDQLHYGDAHITRLDADVGHGGVSTFLAFDLHGQVIVIEMPGGTIEHARVYRVTNLLGKGFDQKIITLSVQDMNQDGKPDLIVHIAGESTDIVLYNNGSNFQWTVPK